MKKRLCSLFLALCMVLCLMPMTAFAEGSAAPADITGSGTSDDPYLIYKSAGLKAFRDRVNGQNGLIKQPGAHAKLMNDIVLNDGTFDENGNWSESGTPNEWTPINDYAGTFDGQGHTIQGLYVKGGEHAGLFGSVRGGTVKNVTVTGYLHGEIMAGGIVGRAYGSTTITNCINHARILADTGGGIIGKCVKAEGQAGQQVTLTGCFNTGLISGQFGGLVGEAEQSISFTDCANVGKVSGVYGVGGIIGYVSGAIAITNCYSASVFGGIGWLDRSLGALVGYVKCDSNGNPLGTVAITNSYWLDETATEAIGNINSRSVDASPKTKAAFANGDVLGILKNNRTDSTWADECQYVAAAGMTLPVFKGQGDSHTHSEKTGICTNGIYCACGYLMHGATSGHNWGAWQHLTTSHTRTCKNPGCGLTQSGNCSGGTATCTEQSVCDICHEKYGDQNPDNHTGSLEWTRTATTHSRAWSCCHAETVAEEDHQWENGVCSVCSYVCVHTGGTATCTEQAVCDVCHEKYGDQEPDNHTGPLEWTQTATTHSQAWSCCHAETVAEEDHQWENGVCSVCGYVCVHTGGTATCADKAKCAVCGESYGESDANNHADLEHMEAKAVTQTAQGNIEYWYCTACGKYYRDAAATQEITLADTVTAKLPAETKPTETKPAETKPAETKPQETKPAATQPQTKKAAAAKSPQTGAGAAQGALLLTSMAGAGVFLLGCKKKKYSEN